MAAARPQGRHALSPMRLSDTPMHSPPPPNIPRLPTALAALLWADVALAQQPAPPPITPWRYSEDYRYLADPQNRRDAWWESGKHVELGPHLSFSTGAELRVRHERYRNNEFGATTVSNDSYTLYRFLPYAGLDVGSRLRVFAQLNVTDSNRSDATISPVDRTGNELLQGFIQLSAHTGDNSQWTLRGGRQVLAYGSEKLISVRYGPNVIRTFEGGVLSWHSPRFRVDALAVRPIRNRLSSFNDHVDRQRRLWGLYSTWDMPGQIAGTGLDLYYLGVSNDDAWYDQGRGAETRNTLGARYFGNRNHWSWDLEGIYQYGNFAGARATAWSVASELNYTFQDQRFSPRLGIKTAIISGDRDPTDPRLQTLNVLFPKGKYFGEAGLIGPANLINLHPSLSLDLGNGWSMSSAMIFYWRESLHDGVYGVTGNVLRSAGASRSRYIGTQADLTLEWQVSRQLGFDVAYSMFRPGAFIKDTGHAATVHFIGLQALWRY